MGFRLRYLQHDLELSEGLFAVGRSAGCQLSLDDPLVSRRHAVFSVTGDGVFVEDQRSRNGVLVNGYRIEQRMRLEPGDRVLIGAQELMLLGPEGARETASLLPLGLMTLTRLPAATEAEITEHPITPTIHPPPDVSDTEASMVRRVHAFKLLGGVAEKALAMGRAEEAERILSAPLSDLIEASRAGKRISPAIADTVARLAAKLATATAKGGWADYVIELYQVQSRPCPAPVVDELNNAFRRVTAIDLGRLRAYLAQLREKQATYGPADRFLLHRIEGLERLAALR